MLRLAEDGRIAAEENAKRLAEAKAFADKHLRWGGSLIDPAWIKANGMASTGSITTTPDPDAVITADLDEVVDDIFNESLIMEEDMPDGLNEPVREGFQLIIDEVAATLQKALNGGDVATLGVSRNSDGTFEVNQDELETYLAKTLRHAMRCFQAAAKNAYRGIYELGGAAMGDLARSVHEHQIMPNIQEYAMTTEEILTGFDGMALEKLVEDIQGSLCVGAGPNHTRHMG
jgi:hypothetical protein